MAQKPTFDYDIIIIGSSYLYFRDIEALVYGYVVMGLMSGLADMVLTGSKQSVQIFIVSKKTQELADAIATGIKDYFRKHPPQPRGKMS